MRYLYAILVVLFLASCQTYQSISFFTGKEFGDGQEQLEPGLGYYSRVDSAQGIFRKARIIEVVEPVFEMVWERLPDSLIAQYQLLDDDELIKIRIKKWSSKFAISRRPNRCVDLPARDYYIITAKPEPWGWYRIFRKKELDSLDYFVRFEKQVREAEVRERNYDGSEMGVMENQVYVPAGYWMPYEAVRCSSCNIGQSAAFYLITRQGYKAKTMEELKPMFAQFAMDKMPGIIGIYFGLSGVEEVEKVDSLR